MSDLALDLPMQLLALTQQCMVASNAKLATDAGEAPSVDICKLVGAYFWRADMDIDCDGKQTAQCNIAADPSFSDQTSIADSNGNPLDAAHLPYIVIPQASARFDLSTAGIEQGALAIVLYAGKLSYGVFGDEGPADIIGEGSYAMADSLGIDPDPATGGVDSGATYIVFTGKAAEVDPVESHDAAVMLGASLAKQLLSDN
ncbi:MAG: glycoside hydrolase family 75 protein [Polyangia bacterium]